MRRILIFSLVYYPRFIGGAEIAIKEITDRISPDDIEFDMITLRLDSRLPKEERIGNVNVYRVGWAGKQRNTSDSLAWYLHLNKYALVVIGYLKALSLARKKDMTQHGQSLPLTILLLPFYSSLLTQKFLLS